MLRHYFTIATLLLSVFAIAGYANEDPGPQRHFPTDAAIQALIQSRVDEERAVGIVVSIMEADGSTRVFTAGEAGPGAQPLSEQSVFEIGATTLKETALMQFGIYYYPWYNDTRWAGEPRVCTSTLGQYFSTDPEIVIRHMDLIINCGFDYVIFELVPVNDWCFATVDQSIEIAIQHLRSKGIKWSFLMDAFVVADHEQEAEAMSALVRHIEARGWSDGLILGKSGLPLLFVFFPVPAHAARIRAWHGSDYELRFPAYFPNWGELDDESDRFYNPPWGQCIDYVREQEGSSLFETLTPMGYISFFESTETRNNFDGFASVIPSYDDRHLKRDTSGIPELPLISPDLGATLRSYFEKALATQPDHVIVYGWNEYFEAATIVPTEEYGMAHVEICTEIIRAAKLSAEISLAVDDLQT